MSNASTEASRPKKGRGASSRQKTVPFQGIRVKVPKKLPGTLAFEIAALEEENAGFRAVVNLLKTLLGEDQVDAIKAEVAAKELDLDTVTEELMGLISSVVEASGTTAGK